MRRQRPAGPGTGLAGRLGGAEWLRGAVLAAEDQREQVALVLGQRGQGVDHALDIGVKIIVAFSGVFAAIPLAA